VSVCEDAKLFFLALFEYCGTHAFFVFCVHAGKEDDPWIKVLVVVYARWLRLRRLGLASL
jgi:hypothetical protein